MRDASTPVRTLFLHGLESGPLGAKVIALRADGLDVTAPQLDAGPVAALLREGSRDPDAYRRALEVPMEQGLAALRQCDPEVVVGSSFGAAVLMRMLSDPRYGVVPAVMLAGAAVKLTGQTALPEGLRVVLVHGLDDALIEPADSRLLAASSKTATLIEVHDDHRLSRTTASGLLASIVRLAAHEART
jgi:hypothetical protein